ncbi:septum formation protein Maf [Candidatus Woesearchaeota archaeon]|nr:septum formation protein Maf [Candidatus Woesearchaeota archaeon]
MRLVLASGSIRRAVLLKEAGIDFIVSPSNIDESKVQKKDPAALVEELAFLKAQSVSKRYPDDVILGADTIVVCERNIIGKPASLEDAKKILSSLSGKVHHVYTGICLLSMAGGWKKISHEKTEVKFRNLSEKEIARFVEEKMPLDKAGAYSAEEKDFIEYIYGSKTNVFGLPMEITIDLLRQYGIKVR